MHLLLEMNRWHFKNSLCLQFTVKIKPHHHFQRWQWDSSARVFLGWQTPALIQAWMMSSIHYTMIESLPPRPSVASLLWTKHSSKAPPRLFLAKRWEREREREDGHEHTACNHKKWGIMGEDPATGQVCGHMCPAAAAAEERRETKTKKENSNCKTITGSRRSVLKDGFTQN